MQWSGVRTSVCTVTAKNSVHGKTGSLSVAHRNNAGKTGVASMASAAGKTQPGLRTQTAAMMQSD